MSEDPVDEMARVIEETLRANALRLTASRGGYVGGSQPHATLDSDSGAVDAVARGLLARKVAEPSRAAEIGLTPCPVCPHWLELHNLDGSCGCGIDCARKADLAGGP